MKKDLYLHRDCLLVFLLAGQGGGRGEVTVSTFIVASEDIAIVTDSRLLLVSAPRIVFAGGGGAGGEGGGHEKG